MKEKDKKKVILIGHSMGGKIAHGLLTNLEIANKVNSIIFISTPLDQPVLNMDMEIRNFYEYTENLLSKYRKSFIISNETNVCDQKFCRSSKSVGTSYALDDVLLISIGGGNRDFLVRDALTTSKYSDIHAMVI